MLRKTILAAALLAAATSMSTPAATPLALTRTLGGSAIDPIVAAPYVYVLAGRGIGTWKYVGTTPTLLNHTTKAAKGQLTGAVRVGAYLYASWRTPDAAGGVTVYSLADPANPVLVGEVEDYVDSDDKSPFGIAYSNGHLYLFDSEQGLYVGTLTDPAHPVFSPTGMRIGVQYKTVESQGNRIFASGRSFTGDTYYDVIDTTNAMAPVLASEFVGDGLAYFSVRTAVPYAVGFGTTVSVLDLSQGNNVVARGSIEAPSATDGFISGHFAYGVGFSGMDSYDIANPDAPVAIGHGDLPTLGTEGVASFDGRPLLVTSTDHLLLADIATPATPRIANDAVLSGGAAARDIGFVDGKAVILQQNYGLSIADPQTFAVQARFDADLPEDLAGRDFEAFTLVGHTAYLAAWGYGVFVADLTDPTHPHEIGRIPFDFPDTADVVGDRLYVTAITNDPRLGIIDIADPAKPKLLGEFLVPGRIGRLRLHGKYAFLAEYGVAGEASGGGLRVLDVSDATQPTVVSFFDGVCESAFDLAIDDAATRAYLACDNGLHVIDITDPAKPREIGAWANAVTGEYTTVERHGERTWFADGQGVHELDLSNEQKPVQRAVTATAGYTATRLRATDDGRLFAFGGPVGVHEFAAGIEVPTPLTSGVAIDNLAGAQGDSLLFSVKVPAGARALSFRSYGGTGDVTMYVKPGSAPASDGHDAQYTSRRPGNGEGVGIATPAATTYYVRLVGEKAFKNASILALYMQP